MNVTTTIPRNHKRRIATLRASHTECVVHSESNDYIATPCAAAAAWEHLDRYLNARLTEHSDGTVHISSGSHRWYVLSKPPAGPQPLAAEPTGEYITVTPSPEMRAAVLAAAGLPDLREPDPVIEAEVWENDPDRPGYLKLARRRTVREMYDAIRAAVGDSPEGCNEYLMITSRGWPTIHDSEWPHGRTIVYATTGGNEGHYIHADVISSGNKYVPVLTGKTFDGLDAAWAFAKRLAKILAV